MILAQHTLTVYKLNFSYMKRNNPLHDELKDKIKNNQEPEINLLNLLINFKELSDNKNYDLLHVGNRIITVDTLENGHSTKEMFDRIFVKAFSGRTDKTTKMIQLDDNKEVLDYDEKWASTYMNFLFFYIIDNDCYLVCHRYGGTGCKTILLEVLNNILRPNGIQIIESLIPPPMNDNLTKDVDKVIFSYEKDDTTDCADSLSKKNKKVPVKEIVFNVKANPIIQTILRKYTLREITKEQTISEMSQKQNIDGYSSVSLVVRMGKSRKLIRWDDFENMFGSFDITNDVAESKASLDETIKTLSDSLIVKMTKR